MIVAVNKCDNKFEADCYYETKFKKSGIIGIKEYNVMYDANKS